MSRLLSLSFISLLFISLTATEAQEVNRKPAEINILHAESMEAPYEGMVKDMIRLLGNVRFRHEEVLMSCDSAHRYANTNTVHAFGNVYINQGDTLRLYGDHLIYYGNRKYAEVRQNVRLIDKETTLTTDYLDFDLENNFGYYPSRGVVINGDNRLESVRGYYYTRSKLFYFTDSVVITNPDYVIDSDTLRYNTLTEVVYFLGPTTITGDPTRIYCENGWYNTQTDISQFNENARVNNNNQILSADSIYYDNRQGTGKAFMNVEVTDTVENIIIKGNHAWFVREPEQMLVTDKALLIQMSDNDTLFMHADTLRSWLQVNYIDTIPPLLNDTLDDPGPGTETEEPSTIEPETEKPEIEKPEIEEPATDRALNVMTGIMAASAGIFNNDTVPATGPLTDTANSGKEPVDTVRIMVAYYGVRFFSNDMQGKCDSMYYNMRDSIIFMFGDPVVWSDESQLTAEFMEIHSKDGEVDQIVMKNSALIVSEEEPEMYNQIRGRDILGYVKEGELYRVNVSGNAETLYYPRDNDELIGINKAESASLVIFIKDNKPDRIRFLNKPDATLYPMEELPETDRLLNGFRWLDSIRPISPEDVFRK
jgi:lipopolysaccharide export system protein LptA